MTLGLAATAGPAAETPAAGTGETTGRTAGREAAHRDRRQELHARRERTATRPKSARFDWGDGDTRVNVTFLVKDGAQSTRRSSTGASPTQTRRTV